MNSAIGSGISLKAIDPRLLSVEEIGELLESIDETLAVVLKISAVELTRAVEDELSREMTAGWKGSAGKALRDGAEAIAKRNKDVLSREDLDAFLGGLGKKLDKPLTDRQVDMLGRRIRRIYRDAKKLGANEAKAKFSFTLRDQNAIKAINRQQVFWVGNFYNDELSKRVRGVSEEILLKRGYDSRKAGKELERVLRREFSLTAGGKTDIASHIPARYAGNTDLYFRQVASTAAHQSRSIGKIFAYQEAGVLTYRLSNPMDRRTGQICQHMAGQVFSVSVAVNHAERLLAAKNPEDVRGKIQPWHSGAKLGQIVGDAKPGTPDASARLAAAGAILPPFHPLCRTEPVIVDTPKAPIPAQLPAPKPREKPAVKLSPLDVLLRSKALRGSAGEAIPGDGQAVEGQEIHWRVERGLGTEGDRMVVRFKMTDQEGERLEREWRSAGVKSRRWKPHKQGRPIEGGLIDKSEGANGSIGFDALKKKIAGAEVNLVRERGALMNYVEIRFPTADARKAYAKWQQIAQEMGIPDGAAFPPPQYARALQQARIITQWDEQAWNELRRLQKLTPEAIDDIFKRAVARHPDMQKVLDDMKPTQVSKGHVAYHSKEQVKQFVDLEHLYHDVYDADVLQFIVGEEGSGLLSSVNRFNRGIFAEGMSTEQDFRTGGADGVFLRMSFKGQQHRWGGRVRIIIDKNQVGRSDWYAFNFDNYGAAGPNDYQRRLLVPKIKEQAKRAAKTGEEWLSSGNEIIMKDGVPDSAIKKILISDRHERERIIKLLKDRGVEKIGGKPIDDVIVGSL